MNKKDADIIIISYNRKDLLIKILSALSTQSNKNFNLIISDDGSSNEQITNPTSFPIITKFIWTVNTGYNKVARSNEAMKMCVSDNLILLDDDCIPQNNNFVSRHVQDLKDYKLSRGIIQFPEAVYDKDAAKAAPYGQLWFSAANLGIKRCVMEEIGYYDEKYNGYYGHEDMDLGETLKKYGYSKPAPFHNETLIRHFGKHYANGDRSENIIGHNTKYFTEKWGYTPEKVEPWKKLDAYIKDSACKLM